MINELFTEKEVKGKGGKVFTVKEVDKGKQKELFKNYLLELQADPAKARRFFENIAAQGLAFHNYSFGNLLMALFQRPDFELLAGFNRWKELNRKVKKSEKGIVILAPVFFSGDMLEKRAAAIKAQKPALSLDQIRDRLKHAIAYFKNVYVFDVKQTDGAPLDYDTLTGHNLVKAKDQESAQALYSFLLDFTRAAGFEVNDTATHGKTGGYITHGKKYIAISGGLSVVGKISVLLHEIGHYKAGHTQEGGLSIIQAANQQIREAEAQLISFITCRYFNIDNKDFTDVYLSSYLGAMNSEKIYNYFKYIVDLAIELIKEAAAYKNTGKAEIKAADISKIRKARGDKEDGGGDDDGGGNGGKQQAPAQDQTAPAVDQAGSEVKQEKPAAPVKAGRKGGRKKAADDPRAAIIEAAAKAGAPLLLGRGLELIPLEDIAKTYGIESPQYKATAAALAAIEKLNRQEAGAEAPALPAVDPDEVSFKNFIQAAKAGGCIGAGSLDYLKNIHIQNKRAFFITASEKGAAVFPQEVNAEDGIYDMGFYKLDYNDNIVELKNFVFDEKPLVKGVIPAAELAETLPYALKDDSKHNLNGICIDTGKGGLYATDGHRARAAYVSTGEVISGKNFPRFIIPLDLITAAAACGAGDLKYTYTDKGGIIISAPLATIYGRAIDETFPEIEKVELQPAPAIHEVNFNKAAALAQIKAAIKQARPLANRFKKTARLVGGALVYESKADFTARAILIPALEGVDLMPFNAFYFHEFLSDPITQGGQIAAASCIIRSFKADYGTAGKRGGLAFLMSLRDRAEEERTAAPAIEKARKAAARE
jgi:hypothetical protein